MPRRLKNHATKQAQTAQKTAKKQTVTTSAIIGVLLFSAMIFHFFRIYIYIYICCIFPQFLRMSISAAFPIALHFVPSFCSAMCFFLGWSNLKKTLRKKPGSPVAGDGTISPYSILHIP
jgi:hypothetical protein